MTEIRHTYRLSSLDLDEANRLLGLLGDRLDELEGRRGTPTFYADADMKSNRITNLTQAAASGEALSYDTDDSIEVSGGQIKLRTGYRLYTDTDGVNVIDQIITLRIPHTWTVPDDVAVPSGDTDFIPGFFVKLPTGQTAQLVSARHRINNGTSATIKLQKNGTDITGFTGISVTTTSTTTDATDVDLADNDYLALIVTAVAGSPKGMSFTVFIDYTV